MAPAVDFHQDGSVAHAFQLNVIMADFHKDDSVADWKRSRPSNGTHSPTLHRISLRDGDYTARWH